jgi:hypothetical protein
MQDMHVWYYNSLPLNNALQPAPLSGAAELGRSRDTRLGFVLLNVTGM